MKPAAALLAVTLMLTMATACTAAPDRVEPEPPPAPTLPAASPTPAAQATPSPQTGTFQVGDARFRSYEIPVEAAVVALADLDGDGHLDLIGAGEPELSLFRGDGRGGLVAFQGVPGGEQPHDFAVADLNGDTYPDIAIANHDTDYLTLLFGDGAGAFEPAPNSPLRIEVLPHPHAVRAADLDGDGQKDLVVDHRQAEGLLVLRGLGEGRFDATGMLIEVGGDPYLGMALGDLNGDGSLDLVTPNPTHVGVFLSGADGLLQFTAADLVPADTPFAVGLGDFNGDGHLDLVTGAGEGSDRVEVFLGDGLGGFAAAAGSPFGLATGGKNVVVGDFNGDGVDDAAVAGWQRPDVMILLGGREGFQTVWLPGGENPWGLASGDLNEDGKDDLVIGDGTAPSATVYVSTDS